MRRVKLPIKRFIIGLLVAVIAGQAILPQAAMAISWQGPDPRDYSAGNNVWLEVSQNGSSNSLDARTSIVSLYFKKPNNNRVTIEHMDHCRYTNRPASVVDTDKSPSGWPASMVNQPGRGDTRFTVTSGGRGIYSVRNTIWQDNGGFCENVRWTFNISGLSRSSQPGLEEYYEAQLRADIVDQQWAVGTVNAFKVELDRGAGCNLDTEARRNCNYVSFSRFSGNRFALQQRGLSGTQYERYALVFGPNCTVTSPRWERLEWFDDDQGQGNQTREIWFRVLRKPHGAPLDQFRPLGPDKLQGARADGYYRANSGNNREGSTYFLAEPGYDYNWEWHNVQRQNGIQFQIPFESIYYQVGCQIYQLTPSTDVSDAVAVNGQQVTFRHRVFNEGQSTSPSVNWETRQRTIDGSAGTYPAEEDANNVNGRGGVQNSGTTRYAVGTHRADNGTAGGWYNETVTVRGNPGDKICRSLGLTPAGNGVRSRYSAESCVLIAKRPTVHFMGADVSVGSPYRSDSGSCATRADTGGIYTVANDEADGSVVEYASFTRALINFQQGLGYGFGTASQPGSDVNRVAQLGFANTDGDNVGAFDNGECMTDYYAKYSTQIPAQASPGSRSFGGKERVHYRGDVTINASDIQNGADVLVVVDGDVTINGNIRYGGSYGSTNDIPSFALVAGGDIRIKDNVTRLDGIYSSKGVINTCSNAPAQLSTNVCNQQLVINGAIVTDELRLRRTHGAEGSNKEQPAERFNYTTELFFRNVLSDGGDQIETMEQRDLPPRY